MKRRLASWSRLLLPIAATAAIGIGVVVPAASADTRSSSSTRTSGCSMDPAPPAGFTEQKVKTHGIRINYVRGGHGPTLLLIHGYPQSWYDWDDVLPALAAHYTVVAPDLPGAGDSSAPAAESDYTKKAMAADIYGLMAKLGLTKNVSVVGHDIGSMVAYSYAAAHRSEVTHLVLSEAPLPDPSIYTLPALTANGPGLWWFGEFNDPGNLAYKMFKGKEKQWVYGSIPVLERPAGVISQCDLAMWTHDLEKPGHLQATIDWFSTFAQDIKNDAIYQKTKLTMPVLAIGAADSLGSLIPDQTRQYASHVTGLVVPNAGHWLYEEYPSKMSRILLHFLG